MYLYKDEDSKTGKPTAVYSFRLDLVDDITTQELEALNKEGIWIRVK